jgi:hypothetical protein
MGAGSFSPPQVLCVFPAPRSDAEGSSGATREDGNPKDEESLFSGGDVGIKILLVVRRPCLIGLSIARIEEPLGAITTIN